MFHEPSFAAWMGFGAAFVVGLCMTMVNNEHRRWHWTSGPGGAAVFYLIWNFALRGFE